MRRALLSVALVLVGCGGCDDPAPTTVVSAGGIDALEFLPPESRMAILRIEEAARRASNQESWMGFAHTCLANELRERAESAYLEAAGLPGDRQFDAQYLAGVAATRFAPGRAEKHIAAALAMRGRYVPAHLRHADVLLALGRQNEAKATLERTLQMEVTAHALLGLGRIALDRGEDDEARTLLEDAWRRHPGRPEIAAALAQALRRAGREDMAQELAESIPRTHHWTFFEDPVHEAALRDGEHFTGRAIGR